MAIHFQMPCSESFRKRLINSLGIGVLHEVGVPIEILYDLDTFVRRKLRRRALHTQSGTCDALKPHPAQRRVKLRIALRFKRSIFKNTNECCSVLHADNLALAALFVKHKSGAAQRRFRLICRSAILNTMPIPVSLYRKALRRNSLPLRVILQIRRCHHKLSPFPLLSRIIPPSLIPS